MSLIASSADVVARQLMLEDVRRHVPDERVLAAMRVVGRELFVAPESRALAHADRPLPAEGGGVLAEAVVVARVLSALGLVASDRVLVSGSDGGYTAAVAARLSRDVIAIAPRADAGTLERRLLQTAARVCVMPGNPLEGWEEQAPFDAIALTDLQTEIPPTLVAQLGLGGRLVVPMHDADGEMLARIVREGPGRIRLDRLGPLHPGRVERVPIARAG